MGNIVNIPTQLHKPASATEIMRLRAMVASVRQQLDWIDATIAAMLPDHEGAARYQRQRSICADRAKINDFLEGRDS
jgi:hypothetical protein